MAAAMLCTTFLLNIVFILLSGASPEARRCYWCGPLAEQVHRSRRSAACGSSDHVTVCEPGYNYCAVVATSPPRVESRYCVKMYQDECYPLYCNSTKTWKMTCPCRGDLCNGPNTERETEAFARLPKLVAKTHSARIKKRTANQPPRLVNHEWAKPSIANRDAEIHNSNDINNIIHDNKLIVTENDVMFENMQSEQPNNIVVEHHNEENEVESTIANQDKMQATTNRLIEIEIHVSDPTEESNTMKGNEQRCTDATTTTEPNEADRKTDPVTGEGDPVTTTIESISKIESSVKTIENMIETTEVMRRDATETELTDKPHDEPTTEIMPSGPINPTEQMQKNASPQLPTEVIPNDPPMKTVEQMQIDTTLGAPASTMPNDQPMKPEKHIQTDAPPRVLTSTMQNDEPMNPEEQIQYDAPPGASAATMPNDRPIKPEEKMQNDTPHTAPVTTMPNDQPMNLEEQMQNDASPKAPAATMPNDQPIYLEEQMQNDAPPERPKETDNLQPTKTTETIKPEESSPNDIVKPSNGIPTAEVFQQNGNRSVSAASIPVTEKLTTTPPTTEPTSATTVHTILTTRQQVTKITATPASRRKNKAERISFNYVLLLICLIYY